MVNIIKKSSKIFLITSFLLCALGIIMIAQPVTTLYLMIMLLGAILIISGVLHFRDYFSIKEEERGYSFGLALAIINVLIGAVCIGCAPTLSIQLSIILGFVVAFQSIINIQLFVNSRQLLVKNNNWVFASVLSVLGIVLGIVMIFLPIESMEAIIRVAGIILVLNELVNIIDNVYLLFSIEDHEEVSKKKSTKK